MTVRDIFGTMEQMFGMKPKEHRAAVSEEHVNKFDKEYEAFQIFEHIQLQEEEKAQKLPEDGAGDADSAARKESPRSEDPYYEIEYDSSPLPGGHRDTGASAELFVKPPDKIEPPPRDEIRELFNRMRDIARENRYLNFSRPKFYDKRTQQENAKIFYKQGMFMKDFEDEYEKIILYSAYFPNYQMMGYDQLRTYFTWRTKVRQGNVAQLSLSYAFLYIYELLNNIGVEDPGDGLDRLLFFWEAFREYDKSVDKYVPRWLKDYYIYYGLPGSFQDYIRENGLETYYPDLAETGDRFDLLCSISKYDIRESAFYTEERKELIRRCFAFTMDRLKDAFGESHILLEDYIFQPTRNMTAWSPFQGALFYPAGEQPDRRVVLSEREVYLCSQNHWTFSRTITTESGKRLTGYVMKRMEVVLRQLTGYKYRLSANRDILSPVMADELKKAGMDLEKMIGDSVTAFYREETKTVIRVDPGALEKIRLEAYAIQEKLIVPEDGDLLQEQTEQAEAENQPETESQPETEKQPVYEPPARNDQWKVLREALTETEAKALSVILNDKPNLKQFADEQGVMLEVLAEGINEKASDVIGDGLLDNEFDVYEDYLEEVREMLKDFT